MEEELEKYPAEKYNDYMKNYKHLIIKNNSAEVMDIYKHNIEFLRAREMWNETFYWMILEMKYIGESIKEKHC